MNKKGAGLLFAIVIAGMIFFAGILALNFFKNDITDFRTNMNCSDSTITDGAKLACLGGDLVMPYFILAIISSAMGIILMRLTL